MLPFAAMDPTDDRKVTPLANPIKAMRDQVGLSLRELELRTGIHRAVLSQVERGLVPTPDQARIIAAALADAARETPRDAA